MGPKSRLREHSPDAAGVPRGRRWLERARSDGAELEYEVSGTGEPVVFIHGAFIADTFRPLLAEPSLGGRYQLILYHRRGYAGSSRASEPVSVARQAADCRALLRHLGVERAHVVGHSYGGIVALQLALDAPGVAHSLALLEPGLMVGASAQGYRESLARGVERYRQAGAAVVVDEFLLARWPGYRATLERVLPGAFAQAMADAETWFEREASGQLGWHFGEAEVRRISQPTLSVLGGESDALWSRFGETHRLLLEWLAHGSGFVLPGTTHFMQIQDPRGMAEALAAFWARHPLATGVA
jgi:pimeloyl-ACP methyl ester carboxylesterase